MALYVIRHREVHDKYVEVTAEHHGQAVRKALEALKANGVGAKAGELEVVEALTAPQPGDVTHGQ